MPCGTVVKHHFVRIRSAGHPNRTAACSGGREKVRAALRYLERRPLGTNEALAGRALFDSTTDGINRSDACIRLTKEATAHIAYHSLILSPGSVAEGFGQEQFQVWTRQILAELEARWRSDLVWVACVHRHTAHPHVHVLIGASATRTNGKSESVRFSRDDYAALRQSGDRWADRMKQDHSLMREVEQYLILAAASFAADTIHHLAGSGVRTDDEPTRDEDYRRREDADRRR